MENEEDGSIPMQVASNDSPDVNILSSDPSQDLTAPTSRAKSVEMSSASESEAQKEVSPNPLSHQRDSPQPPSDESKQMSPSPAPTSKSVKTSTGTSSSGSKSSKKSTASGVFGKGLAFNFQKKTTNIVQHSSVFARTRAHGARTISGSEGEKGKDGIEGEKLGDSETKEEGSMELEAGEEAVTEGGEDAEPEEQEVKEEAVKQEASPAPEKTEEKEKKDGFVKILCRDGETELEWPSEMIENTVTQPIITFSVNPLFFNFGKLVNDTSLKTKFDEYEQKIALEDGAKENVSNVKKKEKGDKLKEKKLRRKQKIRKRLMLMRVKGQKKRMVKKKLLLSKRVKKMRGKVTRQKQR